MATNFKLPDGLCITGGTLAAIQAATAILENWCNKASIPVILTKASNASDIVQAFEERRKKKATLIWNGPHTIEVSELIHMRATFEEADFKMIEIRCVYDACSDIWKACCFDIVRKWFISEKFITVEYSEDTVELANRLAKEFFP